MSRIKKLLAKFFNDPRSIKYTELEKLLIGIGFDKIEAKGSHKKFKHGLMQKDFIIPVHDNDCKDFYKLYALKIIKSILCQK